MLPCVIGKTYDASSVGSHVFPPNIQPFVKLQFLDLKVIWAYQIFNVYYYF